MMPIAIRMIPMIPTGLIKNEAGRLQRPSTADQVNDQDDNRDDEQQVDKRAAEMADEAEEPENQQDNKYSPEHRITWLFILLRARHPGCAYRIRFLIGQTFGYSPDFYINLNKILAAKL